MIGVRPGALEQYTRLAGDMAGDLHARASRLGEALDAFRASEGWSDFLDDLPPLDIDLAAESGRLDRLGEWTTTVAAAFRAADGSYEDGVKTVDESDVLGDVERLDGEAPLLVPDSDRWILNGSDAGDHVQVRHDENGWHARVGRLDADGDLVYRDVDLTDEQAANLVLRTGDGNDVIEVSPDAGLRITVWSSDGQDLVGAGHENPGTGLGGSGDDRIFTGDDADVVFGGAGDDEIYGGEGRDVLDGQDGDDIVVGGEGFDVLHGGRDADRLHGGTGDDALEGGSGEDRLSGGEGADLVSGGRDDDVLDGGGGGDHLFGGRGTDVVDGGRGRDTSTGEAGEHALDVEEVITIELTGEPGSTALRFPRPDWMSEAEHEAWLEHVDADLELIRTTPAGRAGLEALDDASHESDAYWLDPFVDVDRHIVVVPYGSRGGIKDGFSAEDWLGSGSDGGVESLPGNSASPPFPTGLIDRDAEVSYGHMHSNALDDRPPAVSLYHELSHAYDQILGGTEGGDYTEVLRDADGDEIARYEDTPRSEINSVGRDLDGDGDIDTRENAKGHDHPTSLTENSLREDLGWDLRDSYVYETDPGETVEIEELE